MEIIYAPKAQSDLEYWRKSGQVKIQKKISQIVRSITETPFSVIGKPEPLKHNLSGFWSRRINQEHRLVYEVLEDRINIISLRYHYYR